jgi:hypothetical protein
MPKLARTLLPLLALVAACGRHALPGNPRHDGSTDPPPSVVEAPGVEVGQPRYRESTERFTQIVAGSANTCGVTTDGRVRCWGSFGDCRDLEDECPTARGNFVPKRADQTAKRLSVGFDDTCAINLEGSINCWGRKGGGMPIPPAQVDGVFTALSIPFAIRASDGAIVNVDPPLPLPPDAGWSRPSIPAGSFVDVSGFQYYCGIRSDGTLTCWGSSRADGVTDEPPAGSFTQLAVTNYFGCALETDSEIVCWGWGTKDWEIVPQFTPFPGGTSTQLAARGDRACGLRPDGSIVCWGELFGFTPPEGQFIQVTVGNTSVVYPPDYASAYFCALRADGIAVCWGENYSGESSPP